MNKSNLTHINPIKVPTLFAALALTFLLSGPSYAADPCAALLASDTQQVWQTVTLQDTQVGHREIEVKWPELKTDKQIVQFLLAAEAELPEVWEGMSDYDIDYFSLLHNRDKFNAEAKQDPSLAKQVLYHNEPIKIQAKFSEAPAVGAKTQSYNPADLEQLGLTLNQTLSSFSSTKPLKEQVWQSLMEMKAFDKDLVLGAYIFKFLKGFPEEQKKEVFKLTIAQKKAVIENQMTPEMVHKSFNEAEIEAHHLLTSAGRASAIQIAEQRDLKIRNLLALTAYLGRPDVPQTIPELQIAFSKMNDTDAAFYGNREEIKKALKLSMKDPSVIKAAASYLDEESGKFASAKVAVAKELDDITIEEKLSLLGEFRGCPEGGCVTKNMALYSSLYHSRTFFIDPQHEGGRAALEVATVDVKGVKNLYITFLDGPLLTADKAERIVRVLYALRSHLGVENIMLPTYNDLRGHANNTAIRERLRSIVAGHPEVDFTYLDNPLREKIRPLVNDGHYYSQNEVNKAVIFVPTSGKFGPHGTNEQLVANVEAARIFTPSNVAVPKGSIMLVAFKLDQNSNNRGIAERILHGGEVDLKEYDQLKSVLINPKGLSTAEYFESANEALNKVGLSFDPTFKKIPISIYYSGLLRCPDAFTEKWSGKATAGTLDLLKKGSDLDEVTKVIKEHRGNFEASKKLQDYLAKLFTYDHAHGFGRTWHRVQFLGKAGFNLSVFPEQEATLVGQLKSNEYDTRRAGAGTMLLINHKPELAYPVLFELDSQAMGQDPQLNRLFTDVLRLYPAALHSGLKAGLKSADPKIKAGAQYTMLTLEKVDPSVKSLVHAIH